MLGRRPTAVDVLTAAGANVGRHYRTARTRVGCTPQKHSTSSSQFQAGQRSSLKDTLRYTAACR
jgi:hypothetical protein